MYFKQRENSALYKYYQQEEQQRHIKKIEQIKTRRLKSNNSQNLLPPLTHRVSQVRPCQKALVQAETERLSKRILQLKTNRSDYFSKVIGLSLSGQWQKGEKKKLGHNLSAIEHKHEFN